MGTTPPSDLSQSPPGTTSGAEEGGGGGGGRSLRSASGVTAALPCAVCLGSPLCICTPDPPKAKGVYETRPAGPKRRRSQRRAHGSRRRGDAEQPADTATPPQPVSERGRPPETSPPVPWPLPQSQSQSRRQLFKAETGDNLGEGDESGELCRTGGVLSTSAGGTATPPRSPSNSSSSSSSTTSTSSASSSNSSSASSFSSSSSSYQSLLPLPSTTTTSTSSATTSTWRSADDAEERRSKGVVTKVKRSGALSRPAPAYPQTPPVLGRTRHPCPRCPKTFGSPGKLSQHMYSHTGERPFSCQHCTKAFSSKFKLVRHALIHSDLRQYVCPVCERTFHRKDHLKNHAKVHDPVKSVYSCERPGCGKEYTSSLSYRKHAAVHSAEDGNLECAMCGTRFASKDEIVFHLKVHAGSRTVKTAEDRKYRCERCDRSFFTGKDVRRHMVVHTGKRDFLCQFCPQRFGRKDHLVRHIKKSHNSGASAKKKGKAKRTDAKTKSVKSILAEVATATATATSASASYKKEDARERSSEFEALDANYTVDIKPICQTGMDGDLSVVFTDETDVVSVSREGVMSPVGLLNSPQSVLSPSGDGRLQAAAAAAYVLDPFSGLDALKSDPDMISIDQLPLLILPATSATSGRLQQDHQQQERQEEEEFLAQDEEAQQLSRHIMNLTAPGSADDSCGLIIGLPTFPGGECVAAPANTTPLPRFNQAFNQQQQTSASVQHRHLHHQQQQQQQPPPS